MKKIATLILATIIWTVCSAQDNSDTTCNKNFLYLNPIPFINNTIQINYERLLTKKIGLLFSIGYTLVDGYGDGKKGGNGELQFRIYLSDKKTRTRNLFYFSPYARFQYIESTLGYYRRNYVYQEYYFVDQPDVCVSSYTGGLLIGFKWVLNTRLTIDTYIGGGMQISQYKGEKVSQTMDMTYYGYYTGPIPKLGLQFGYNF